MRASKSIRCVLDTQTLPGSNRELCSERSPLFLDSTECVRMTDVTFLKFIETLGRNP
jgi:hypothetical protein